MKRDRTEDSYPKGRAPIRPELVAAKLAAIRNYEHPKMLEAITKRPRLVEMLWHLQFLSFQPGGLAKFCGDMIERLPGRFGTPHMRAVGPGPLSLDSKIKISSEMPTEFWPSAPSLDSAGRTLIDLMAIEKSLKVDPDSQSVADLIAFEKPLRKRSTAEDRLIVSNQIKGWTLDAFREKCTEAAREILPEYLTALCVEKDQHFDGFLSLGASGFCGQRQSLEMWFIDDPIGAVMEMMDARAAEAKARIAMTEVAKLIFDRLDYALAEKVMVRIEGGSRFGKTEALSAWVDMRPGVARLVRVPCDNSMASLFKRIAEALGIDGSYGSNTARLRERIEFVIQHSGLFFVLDEGHFLAPTNFTATTAPHRLNWIRTELADRGLPLAISMTPQAFKGAIDRFVKKTHYDMTQFFGRDFLPCVLPEALSEADLIAVARIHFRELSENALGYIANEARLAQSYLQAVEAIARRSRFLAGKRAGALKLKDIQTAVAEYFSRAPVGVYQDATNADAAPAEPVVRVPKPASKLPVNALLIPIERGIQPAGTRAGNRNILDNRSLRGAGREMAPPELVSAET